MNIWSNNTIQGQYGLDVEQAIQDLLVQELTASIDKSIIDQLFNKQNIRKAKIDTVKEKIRSSE